MEKIFLKLGPVTIPLMCSLLAPGCASMRQPSTRQTASVDPAKVLTPQRSEIPAPYPPGIVTMDEPRFSIGPDFAGKNSLFAFWARNAVLFQREVDDASGDWRRFDLMPFLPKNEHGVSPNEAYIFGFNSAKVQGGEVVQLASVLAYYPVPDEPAAKVSYVLRRTQKDTIWKIVLTEKRPIVGAPYRFVFVPDSDEVYAFFNALVMGSAEDEFGSLFESKDRGLTWQPQRAQVDSSQPSQIGLPFALLQRLPNGDVWAATDNPCKNRGGISYKPKNGQWRSMFDKVPTRMVKHIEYDEAKHSLYFFTKQQGSSIQPTGGPAIFRMDTRAPLKSAEVKSIADIPGAVDCAPSSCIVWFREDNGDGGYFLELEKHSWKPLSQRYDTNRMVLHSIPGETGRFVTYQLDGAFQVFDFGHTLRQ